MAESVTRVSIKPVSQIDDLNGVVMSVSRVKQPRWQLTGLAMALAAAGMFHSPQVLACPSGTVDGTEALDSDCSIVLGNTVGVATTGTLELNDFIWSIEGRSVSPFGKIENEGAIEATGSTGSSYILIDNINNGDSSGGPVVVLDNMAGASITKPSTTASSSDRSLVQIKDSSGISVTNAGSIRSSVSGDGVVKVFDSTNTAISNSGIIAARLTDDVAYADDSAGVVIDSLDEFGDGTVATITNQTGGLIGGYTGLFIGTNKSEQSIQSNITNSGVIEGSSGGIYVGGEGLVFSLSNNENARVGRSVPADTFQYGVALAGGQIITLTNEGTIEGGQFGAIFNQGTIDTLTNETTGTLDGAIYVRPSGALGSFTNEGTVQGTVLGPGQFVDVEGEYAIYNAGTITTLTNEASGRLEGDVVVGTVTDGFMTNRGVIDGKVTLGSVGLNIEGESAQIKGAVTGTGEVTIDGTFTTENTFDVGIINIASNGSLTVNDAVISPVKMPEAALASLQVNKGGSIRSGEPSGTVVWSDRSDGSEITNAGTIESRLAEGEDYATGSVGVLFRQEVGTADNRSTLTNQAGGVIGAQTGVAVGFESKNNDQAVVSISNAGTINGADYGLDVRRDSTITLLDNMDGGTISGGDAGLRVRGEITTLTNKGTIDGAVDLASSGTIGSFTNEGTIEGSSLSELGVYAIYSPGTITTLTNQKGATIEGAIGFTASTSSLGTFTNNGDVKGQVEFRFVESSPSLVNKAGGSIRSAETDPSGGLSSVVEVTESSFAVVSNAGIIAARLSDTDDYAEGSVGVTFVGEDLTLNNREGGQIGATTGVRIGNDDGDTTTLSVTNAGTIDGDTGIYINEGATVSSLDNKATGEITSIGTRSIRFAGGSIETLTNEGLIQGMIDPAGNGEIGTITNKGTMRAVEVASTSSVRGSVIRSNSPITSLINEATIEGRIFSRSGGSIGSLTNKKGATIRAIGFANDSRGAVIEIAGDTTVTNAGVIAARLDDDDPYVTGSYGVTLKDGAATFNNLVGGLVGGAIAGLQIDTPSTDESTQANITNAGTVEGSLFGMAVRADAFVDEFANREGGIIRGQQVGVFNEGTVSTLSNDGTIEGAVYQVADRTITTLTNKGTIKAATGGELAGYAIYNAGTIGTLTNDATGTLEGNVLVGTVTDGFITNKGVIDGTVTLGSAALNIEGTDARITGAVTGTDTVNINGTFTTESTFDVEVFNIATGGTLTLAHKITTGPNSFHNDGTMIVAVGTQEIVGNFTTSGTFSPIIVDMDNYGKLVVTGDVELGGTLKANNGEVVTSFNASGLPDEITLTDIITYTGGRTGEFDEVVGANDLFAWDAQYDDDQQRVNLVLVGIQDSVEPQDSISEEPEAVEPEVNEPETVEPETVEPEAVEPEAVEVIVPEVEIEVAEVDPSPAKTTTVFYQTVSAAGYTPAYQAARALDAIASTNVTNPVVLSFVKVPQAQVADAVLQTLPLMTGNSQLAAMNALNDIDDAVKARLDFNRGELTDAAMFTDRKVWMRPFGSWVDQKNRGDYYGYSGSTGGLVIGADANVTTELQLGLAFGYAQANIKGNTPIKSNSYDLDTYQVLGYGRYELGQGTELEFQAGVGMNKNKGTRQISYAGSTAKSSYDSTTASAGLGLRHQLRLNTSTTFTPEVRADYGWISDDGYTETGAQALNLIVKGRDHDQLMLSAGGYVSYDVKKGLALRAGLALGYDALNSQAQITSAYSGAPQTTFVTDGIDPSPWQLMGSLALVGELANGMQISATYGASYRQDFLNQNVSLNLRIGF